MKENKCEQAAKYFNQGLNCSQSVLSVFCQTYGISLETAAKIGCGLGGGARSGELCGAVSGAILVIGLKYGNSSALDAEGKKLCYDKTKEFTEAFRKQNKSIVCKEILGSDLSTPEGYQKAQDAGLFQTRCVDMVKSAVNLLEALGY